MHIKGLPEEAQGKTEEEITEPIVRTVPAMPGATVPATQRTGGDVPVLVQQTIVEEGQIIPVIIQVVIRFSARSSVG